jgi:hypothetical protein
MRRNKHVGSERRIILRAHIGISCLPQSRCRSEPVAGGGFPKYEQFDRDQTCLNRGFFLLIIPPWAIMKPGVRTGDSPLSRDKGSKMEFAFGKTGWKST